MKMPPLKSGVTGFTNEHGDFVCTGSATGRHSSPPGPCTQAQNSTLPAFQLIQADMIQVARISD